MDHNKKVEENLPEFELKLCGTNMYRLSMPCSAYTSTSSHFCFNLLWTAYVSSPSAFCIACVVVAFVAWGLRGYVRFWAWEWFWGVDFDDDGDAEWRLNVHGCWKMQWVIVYIELQSLLEIQMKFTMKWTVS